jgi:hypothetical protein
MAVEIKIPDDVIKRVVKELMENFPEASAGMTMRCTDWRYSKMEFIFMEYDDNGPEKKHVVNEEMLVKAFPLIFTDKWPKGLTKPPASSDYEAWDDWLCQADAFDFDAFIQLACLGEVIYG